MKRPVRFRLDGHCMYFRQILGINVGVFEFMRRYVEAKRRRSARSCLIASTTTAAFPISKFQRIRFRSDLFKQRLRKWSVSFLGAELLARTVHPGEKVRTGRGTP